MEGTKRALIGPVALLIGILAILCLVVRTSLGHPGTALYIEAAKPHMQRTVVPHAKAHSAIPPIKKRT